MIGQDDARTGSVLGVVVDGKPIIGVGLNEGVHCECGDEACTCHGGCTALAIYEWGSVEAGAWLFLCHRCGLQFVEHGTQPQPALQERRDDGQGAC